MPEDIKTGDIVEPVPSCQYCLLLSPGPPHPYCVAFPLEQGGIPDDVWLGRDPHVEVRDGQASDYVFTPRPEVDVVKYVGLDLLDPATLVRHGKTNPHLKLDT